MEKEDDEKPDDSLDATLRLSPFLTGNMFDIIEGSSVLVMELINLLIGAGAISADEVQEMLDRLSREYSKRHPANLAAFTVQTAHDEFALTRRSGVHALERRLHARRARERSAGRRAPQK